MEKYLQILSHFPNSTSIFGQIKADRNRANFIKENADDLPYKKAAICKVVEAKRGKDRTGPRVCFPRVAVGRGLLARSQVCAQTQVVFLMFYKAISNGISLKKNPSFYF